LRLVRLAFFLALGCVLLALAPASAHLAGSHALAVPKVDLPRLAEPIAPPVEAGGAFYTYEPDPALLRIEVLSQNVINQLRINGLDPEWRNGFFVTQNPWTKFDPEGLSAGSQVNDGLRYLSSVSFGEGYQAIAEVTGLAQAGAGLRNLATGNVSRGDLARATGITGAGRLVSGDVSGGELAAAAGVDRVGAGATRLANEGLSAGVLNDASEALPRATLTGAGVVGVGATVAKVSGFGKAAVTKAAKVNAANKASAQSTAPTQTASTTAAVSEGEAAAAIPEKLYRGGGSNPGNLTPRPKDEGMLSTRDSLSNPWPLAPGQKPPLPAGEPIQVIDTSKLPVGSVKVDGAPHGSQPPGHVSIGPNVPAEKVKSAIVETIPKSKTK
jgi:hypothetical protein